MKTHRMPGRKKETSKNMMKWKDHPLQQYLKKDKLALVSISGSTTKQCAEKTKTVTGVVLKRRAIHIRFYFMNQTSLKRSFPALMLMIENAKFFKKIF